MRGACALMLLGGAVAAEAQCSCCGVPVPCPCLPICLCKCSQGPPPPGPAPPAPVPPRPPPPTPPTPPTPAATYLCIFYQGKQTCEKAPSSAGGESLAKCQKECKSPPPPPPATTYLCIFYQGKQTCQEAPSGAGGKPLTECKKECGAPPPPPSPPAPPPAPADLYLCIFYQGKQQCYPAPKGTAGALPKDECEKQCNSKVHKGDDDCYACVMPDTGCKPITCSMPGSYPSKAACTGACPVPTPPTPPAPTPPAPVRYHCDSATSTCVAGSEGHSTLAKCNDACVAPAPPGPPGPDPPASGLPTTTKKISFTGKPCSASMNHSALEDTSFTATVVYPKDSSRRYPVVSFAHGATVSDAYGAYSGTLNGIAARGYVVVAFNGCPTTMYAWHPQVSAIEWLMAGKEASLASIIDTDAQTGVFGHSMGGAATVCAASDTASVKGANIAAAIAMHPGISTGPTKPVVPTLYFAGSSDSIVAPTLVKSKYNTCPNTVGRGYASFTGYTHFSPTEAKSNKEIKWIADLFDCSIRTDSSACDKIFGKGSTSLCGAGETKECETHKAGQ